MAASVTATAVLLPRSACAVPIDYDIVYVRAPRYGDNQNSLWPDTARPLMPDPGAVLMLRQVGVYNTGPAWLAGGRIVFTSSRNNFLPHQSFNSGQRTLQLFIMDPDGRTVEQIGYLNQAMALHPSQLHLIPGGQPISSPSALVLVKNDPSYNEQWPRPVVPYARIHGIAAPAVLPAVRNAGTEHNHAVAQRENALRQGACGQYLSAGQGRSERHD